MYLLLGEYCGGKWQYIILFPRKGHTYHNKSYKGGKCPEKFDKNSILIFSDYFRTDWVDVFEGKLTIEKEDFPKVGEMVVYAFGQPVYLPIFCSVKQGIYLNADHKWRGIKEDKALASSSFMLSTK